MGTPALPHARPWLGRIRRHARVGAADCGADPRPHAGPCGRPQPRPQTGPDRVGVQPCGRPFRPAQDEGAGSMSDTFELGQVRMDEIRDLLQRLIVHQPLGADPDTCQLLEDSQTARPPAPSRPGRGFSASGAHSQLGTSRDANCSACSRALSLPQRRLRVLPALPWLPRAALGCRSTRPVT